MGMKRINDLTGADLPADQPYYRIITQRINPGESIETAMTLEVDEATYTAMFTAASQVATPPQPAGSPAPAPASGLLAYLARAEWPSQQP